LITSRTGAISTALASGLSMLEGGLGLEPKTRGRPSLCRDLLFVLSGDGGQRDPEMYPQIVREEREIREEERQR
jgi:hypothetical protein